MRYIQLTNDSYVLYTPQGLKTITKKSFHYHKIQKLVRQGADADEILPLLESPLLLNGLYEAYLQDDKMIYLHTEENGIQKVVELMTNRLLGETLDETTAEFMGVYASLDDLMEDWPEYVF